MASSYSTTNQTAADQVRLLISDVGGSTGSLWIFDNDEIASFLGLKGGNVFRAAALAFRTIAGNRVQVAQRINYLGLETRGDEEAKAIRELAKEFDEMADSGASSEILFAEFVTSDFGGP